MVVIAASRQKGGLVAVLLLQLESEHSRVEGDRPVEVGDFQVDMADAGARRDGVGHDGLLAG